VVVLGIPTWPDFDLPDNGRLSVPSSQELDGSLHAVACIGYDDVSADMLLRNSWGASWGVDGYAWLPFQFLGAHASEAWTIDGPVSGHQQQNATQVASPRYQ
jgi:C1A family cysteine protease